MSDFLLSLQKKGHYLLQYLFPAQVSVLGIKTNIPNTETVLGYYSRTTMVYFIRDIIPNTETVLGYYSRTTMVYFIRDTIPIIKLAIKRYSKWHLFLGDKNI
jgi:hypothetical protein